MSTRTVEQIDSWNSVPFSGGYGGLHDLADSEFSGAVVAGPTRLFMLNGNVVGILDGSIEDFEDASGTAREAPHPGLPLLAVMQERSDEVRAKYYTEETPLSEVDQTLSSGGFTGYVELSENVLSGDYYQIYHQGRSMSVAWVGNSDQRVTEDEAFEQASGEVGIYEVRPVDIDIVAIPESEAVGGGAAGTTDEAPGGDRGEPTDDTPPADHGPTGSDTQADPATGNDRREAGGAGQPTGASDGPSGETRNETGSEPAGRTTDTGSDPVAKTGAGSTAGRPRDDDRPNRSERTSETSSGRRDQEPAEADSGQRERREREADRSTDDTDRSGRTPDGQPRDQRGRDEPTQSRDSRDEPDRRDRTTDTHAESASGQSSSGQRSGVDPGRQRAETNEQPPAESSQSRPDQPRQSNAEPATSETGSVAPAPNDPSAGGASDLETRSIPSLDPSHSGTASAAATAAAERTKAEAANGGGVQPDAPEDGASGPEQRQNHPGAPTEERTNEPAQQPRSNTQERTERTEAETNTRRTEPSEPEPEPTPSGPDPERVDELEQALAETETERDQLQSDLDTLAGERDELQSELQDARAEIERLEERIEEMAAEDDDTPTAETRLSEREAIDQTNLFVRYKSKGDATLEGVHSGNAARSTVDDNLRLEFHTQFDAATAAVGNTEFETFLTESIQFRFVDWLVRNLLFEIRDTGNPEAMAELYDALPQIDRAELNGQVTVEYTEDGEQHRAQEQFDVVVRDRMGNPLVVANINDSRDPATDDMMTDLITRAERVGASSESLAGAFLVTESFFEPPALETAEEATSSGLLSRDKRKSFINLSRKDGYHLCLVEARNQEFHLAVPEL